jgi:hypothetical protein
MAAPEGNEYWKLRSKDGRDKIFETPEHLLDACNEYFEWVQNNPLKSSEVVKYKDYAELIEVPKMRPMTIEGLCNFIDISVKCWRNYKERQDFIPITTRVEQIIYNNKFEGAASGFLNPNIIARDLGLQDKQQTEHTGEIIVRPPKFD